MLVGCSFLEYPSELRVESDGHDLGWPVAEAWPALGCALKIGE